jgi:hypothetical protein
MTALEWQSPAWGVRTYAMRDFRDAGDQQERSRLVNSLAAQEFGGDATDPYGAQAVGVGIDYHELFGFRLRLDGTLERQAPLAVYATPSRGAYEPTLPAMPLRAVRLSLAGDRATALSLFGTEVRASGEFRLGRLTTDDARFPIASTLGRAFASLWVERPIGRHRLVLQTLGGAVGATGEVPAQERLYFGGPVSAPGYGFHELSTLAGISQRIEWRFPVPAPSVSLGRFGRVPPTATLAPFAQATLMRRGTTTDVAHPAGAYPSVGVAVQPFFDLLRLQLARGLRNGGWSLNVDVSRDFWGVL